MANDEGLSKTEIETWWTVFDERKIPQWTKPTKKRCRAKNEPTPQEAGVSPTTELVFFLSLFSPFSFIPSLVSCLCSLFSFLFSFFFSLFSSLRNSLMQKTTTTERGSQRPKIPQEDREVRRTASGRSAEKEDQRRTPTNFFFPERSWAKQGQELASK